MIGWPLRQGCLANPSTFREVVERITEVALEGEELEIRIRRLPVKEEGPDIVEYSAILSGLLAVVVVGALTLI